MIEFEKFILDNGLTVLFHKDKTTPIAAVNVLYKVGSRDENPDKTGFAHLFEHLMFEGSKNIPVYDQPLEQAGGSSNAYTNFDYTNYYLTIPKDNIETALWLESDRMLELDFSEEKLEIQKNVVIEEFKETVLNRPYGDDYKLLLKLAYTVHPYRWAVIGEDFHHIESATLDDVKDFFFKYYAPNNAILSIAGDFETRQIRELVEKWFGDIPRRDVPVRAYPQEPPQTSQRTMTVYRDVPFDEIMLGFHYFARTEFGTYVADFITDILALGNSSRFYQNLVREKKLFSEIDTYISGTVDKGLLFIYGILNEGIKPDVALNAICEELRDLKQNPVSDYELQTVVNTNETEFVKGRMNIRQKATKLAYYEMLGGADLYSVDLNRYRNISKQDIMAYSRIIFRPEKANILYYLSKKQ